MARVGYPPAHGSDYNGGNRWSASPVKLYRVMKVAADGKPLVGTRRNMLGVRPTDPTSPDPKRKFDVAAVHGSEPVLPGARQGLSASATTAGMRFTRGEAVFEIDGDGLTAFTATPDRPPHHVLEPVRPMTLDEYQAALVATRDAWVRLA